MTAKAEASDCNDYSIFPVDVFNQVSLPSSYPSDQ